jgi:hypothetical protein
VHPREKTQCQPRCNPGCLTHVDHSPRPQQAAALEPSPGPEAGILSRNETNLGCVKQGAGWEARLWDRSPRQRTTLRSVLEQ